MFTDFEAFIRSTTKLPFRARILKKLRQISLGRQSPEQIFSEIFQKNAWGDRDSRSGTGSNLRQTEAIRRDLPLLMKKMGCTSILDIPCGDFYWMKLVDFEAAYIGGDIVRELISNNQEQYGCSTKRFVRLDIIEDNLPRSDLVLCRDCFVHFSFEHAFRALANVKRSGSKYLLTTTFTGRKGNSNIPTGSWRPINLQLPPFNFPRPIQLVVEGCPDENYQDKHLGLWMVATIPDY